MATAEKHGTIAFVTTPDFRKNRRPEAENFIYRHMYSLCHNFAVMTTGRTHTDLLLKILNRPLQDTATSHRKLIQEDMYIREDLNESHLAQWQTTVTAALVPTVDSFPGMIHVAYELVEGRLDAVIHLIDWNDKSAKPDSEVLSREANVHNVPAATDIDTATAFIESWKATITQQSKLQSLFEKRRGPDKPPLEGLDAISNDDKVLALVAHDKMKLEMCCFAVEHARHIFHRYRFVLATGTTGSWLRRFMEASGRGHEEIKRIRCCNSGPLGGDIQIAYAVVKGWCQDVVFLQDPSASHAHDADIRLFEQAVLKETVHVRLATNLAAARLLIGI